MITTNGTPQLKNPQDQSEAMLAFLGDCLSVDADQRGTAAALLQVRLPSYAERHRED
jgi:p21-activated kinase 1